jgi:hypothetical protein
MLSHVDRDTNSTDQNDTNNTHHGEQSTWLCNVAVLGDGGEVSAPRSTMVPPVLLLCVTLMLGGPGERGEDPHA